MSTRLGNAGDFHTLMPMMRKSWLRHQELDPVVYELHTDAEARFRRWVGALAADPRSMMLVAEEEGQIVGFMIAAIERESPIYVCDEFALVREWWVEPGFRSRGVEEALMDRAIAELAAVGIRQIRVRTAAADEDSRARLGHCGFRTAVCEMVSDVRPVAKRASSRRGKR